MTCKHGNSKLDCPYCVYEQKVRNPFDNDGGLGYGYRKFGYEENPYRESDRTYKPTPASTFDVNRLEGEVTSLQREVRRLQSLVEKLITIFSPGEKIP